MGTGRPHVEVTAATLAGGDKNQDRYAYGDGWAFVLDGASSFVKTQPEHDGGWYAERLMQALSAGLTEHPQHTTPEIVEDAIRIVADLHGSDADSCPTSTIALARWNGETVEAYLLGDSTVAFISDDGEEVLSDARLAQIARPIRQEYQSRLNAGHGFDEQHRELLLKLQAQQLDVRNESDGYWIAGAQPEAAHHGMSYTLPKDDLQSVVLATDGAASGIRYGVVPTWADFAVHDPDVTLTSIHDAEASDPDAATWPRSKRHDDKTVVLIRSTNYF